MEKFKKFGIIFTCFVVVAILLTGINMVTILGIILAIDNVTSYLRSKTEISDGKIEYGTKIIWNKILPFGSYCTMMMFGLIFCKHKKPSTDKELEEFEDSHLKHEYIHKDQLLETGYLMYYVLYVVEFITYLLITFNWKVAYKNISFEREAREIGTTYKNRLSYGWCKYWFDFENLRILTDEANNSVK